MAGDDDGTYQGAETTGFQSPAQDHIEHVIDLERVLDLRKPGVYPTIALDEVWGIGSASAAKAEYLSPRYTTRLDELAFVQA